MNRSLLLPALLLLLPLGCGGSGDGTGTSGGANQTLTVMLGSDSDPDLQQAVVSIEKVEISSNSGASWTTLASPKTTGNLLSLQGGHELTLVNAAPVAAGTYTFRITWATVNYSDPTRLPAYAVPAGSAVGYPMSMPTSTVFSGAVAVPSDGSAAAMLMMDTAESVMPIQGAPSSFVFYPAPAALDAASAVTITGNLSAGGTALAGVEVFAEIVDGSGNPHLLRRAISDASGNYTLDGLPSLIDGSSPVYLVLAMPCSASASYSAQGASPVAVAGAGVYTGADITFSSPTTPGAIALHVTPETPAGALTVADLREYVGFGAGTAYVIVRSQTMLVGASTDDYTFANLPQDFFGVNATRYSSAAPATVSSASSVLVGNGTTTDVNLAF